jgi:hypothetical protein
VNSTYTLQRSSRAPGEHFDICVGCGVFQPLLATWVFFLSGVIFPLALVQVTPDPHHRLWMVAFGICTASAARLAWIIGEGRRRLSELIYWVFVYAFLGLAPLVQIREGYWPGTTPRTDWSLVSTALLVVVVGCVAFGVGIFTTEIAMRTNLKIRAFVMASRVSRLPDPRLLCGFAIFSLILNAYFLSQTRVLQFTQSRYNLIELEELETSASFESIVEAAAGMSLLVAFVALVRERRVRSRLSRYLDVARQSNFRLFLTILVGIALLNTMNPISNARYLAGTAILGAAAALGMVRTKRRFRIFAIAFVACIVFIFPFLDAFRYSLQGELKSSGVVASLSSIHSPRSTTRSFTLIAKAPPRVGRQWAYWLFGFHVMLGHKSRKTQGSSLR